MLLQQQLCRKNDGTIAWIVAACDCTLVHARQVTTSHWCAVQVFGVLHQVPQVLEVLGALHNSWNSVVRHFCGGTNSIGHCPEVLAADNHFAVLPQF